jgi:hypothetical protein
LADKLPPHLQDLESESIYILREVASQFAKPVVLYSIGKDSSVLLHLARKTFFPAKPPLPLLHVDTRWKFRDMIVFRDETVKRLGLELIVYPGLATTRILDDGRPGIDPVVAVRLMLAGLPTSIIHDRENVIDAICHGCGEVAVCYCCALAHCIPEKSLRGSMAGLRLSPLRTAAHGSGSMRIATPSSCRTCTDYSLPVTPAHCEKSGHDLCT